MLKSYYFFVFYSSKANRANNTSLHFPLVKVEEMTILAYILFLLRLEKTYNTCLYFVLAKTEDILILA